MLSNMSHSQAKKIFPVNNTFFFDEDSENEYDDNNRSKSGLQQTFPPKDLTRLSIPIRENVRSVSNSDSLVSTSEILKFPTESTHAYSYAHLSPNSLALRLNVLRRSLEILIDRPELFGSINTLNDSNTYSNSHSSSYSSTPIFENPSIKSRQSSLYTHNNDSNDGFKMQANASSAALAALLRPTQHEKPGSPVIKFQEQNSFPFLKSNIDKYNEEFNDDLREIIYLLDKTNKNGINIDENIPRSQMALSLHNLSLSNGGNKVRNIKQNFLKTKLLHALATPFIESLISNPISGLQIDDSALSISSLNNLPSYPSSNGNNRPFHSFSSGKNSVPQAVFTVEIDNPWSLKAANDLACLMFGVSRTIIRSLSLVDLIAPHSRAFVLEKLNRSESNIIFAGEIIAISRLGKGVAWTSMWAKRKDNLMICMFDQIPCNSFDITIEMEKEQFKITTIKEKTGELFKNIKNDYKKLSDLNPSMDKQLTDLTKDHVPTLDLALSELINKTRYYTISIKDETIPCAITSNTLDSDSGTSIKLKIHSMPYIAGMFVISSIDFKMMSFNTAIAKNMFGTGDIMEKSIDFLLPNFTKILELGLSEEYEFVPEPGLVLPEHFFRKFDAVFNTESGNKEEIEKRFLESTGINGLHRDGRALKVDVQLRVSSIETYILWITFSREGKDEPSTNTIRQHDLPSQLKLFPEDENDLLSLGSESTNVSRQNSTRKPYKLDRISSMDSIKLMNEDLEKRFDDLLKLEILDTEFNEKNVPPTSLLPTTMGSSTETNRSTTKRLNSLPQSIPDSIISISTPPSSAVTFDFFDRMKYSEDALLKIENDMIRNIKESSNKWPSVVGEKRRTKKFSEFKVIKDMGVGAYGKVVSAEHLEDPNYKVIIKCIDKERILVDTWVRDRKLGTIPSEIQIMSFLNNDLHPNIMRIVDFFEDEKYYYLETPIHGNPPAIDLFDFIEIKKNISELECRFIFKQIVSSIYHLHKHGIVHRDIKDENVIVDEHGVIKLIDFGSAAYTKSGPFDVFVGTIDYAAPEVLNGNAYDGKPQDIWALGILLYTLIYKENPFYNVDEIMEGDLRIPFILSDDCVRLIRKILMRDIKSRPKIEEIYEDPWLQL